MPIVNSGSLTILKMEMGAQMKDKKVMTFSRLRQSKPTFANKLHTSYDYI